MYLLKSHYLNVITIGQVYKGASALEDYDDDLLEEIMENLLGESNVQDSSQMRVSVSDLPRILLESGRCHITVNMIRLKSRSRNL